MGDERTTLVRFVEKIPFTGQDWDLVEEREMLVWEPDPKGWRCHDQLGEITEGRVLHAYDVKYPYARWYQSLCGKWQPYWKVDGPADLDGRRCKGCVTELNRHQKKVF